MSDHTFSDSGCNVSFDFKQIQASDGVMFYVHGRGADYQEFPSTKLQSQDLSDYELVILINP